MEDIALADGDVRLHVRLDAWEGPLDLLLDLARRQKVDLRAISILALVDQYLAHIAEAQALKLELAADYLVMAAWLAYLKSALLLPPDPEQQPAPEELALRLQLRLARLAAMREAAAQLMARDRVGRDVFRRGAPEGVAREHKAQWSVTLYQVLAAYGAIRARTAPVTHRVAARAVVPLEAALERLAALLGISPEWHDLAQFLPALQSASGGAAPPRSALASGFAAALELARLGRAELAQAAPFAPLMLRAAPAGARPA